MATGNAKNDQNWNPSLIAVSSDDGETPVRLEADPTTGALLTTGGGGGTQYSEGTTTAPATGTVALGRYLSSAPGTLTDGQLSSPLLDNFGQLKVVPVGTTASNVTQLNGVAVSVGNGVTGTGSLRVTIASDNSNIGTNLAQVGGNAVSTGVGAVGTGVQRVVDANGAGRTLLSAGGSASSSGNNTLIAAGTNRLKVYAFSLTTTSTTAMTCIFQSGTSGTELWRVIIQAPSGANAGANLSVAVPSYLFATASATLLNLNLSSANAVHWSVSYYDEA